MSSAFDRWEKDPFFSAAEEVQESADRMESLFRRWMKERKRKKKLPADDTGGEEGDEDVAAELRRELHTALGTTKWQLEEFDRSSRSRYTLRGPPADDGDARTRHVQFVSAIGAIVLEVEDSLRESEMEEGRVGLSWVCLDQGERDELAAFLSHPPLAQKPKALPGGSEELRSGEDCCKLAPIALMTPQMVEERIQTHRRTTSAGNDSGMWAISLSNEDSPRRSFDARQQQQQPHMPKVFSMSRLSGAIESNSKIKWPKNGFRKWKHADELQDSESIPLKNHQANRGLNSCCERSKTCIDSSTDESYSKQINGWFGVIQRQLQRSQYQIQYGRPAQMIFWLVAALLLIVLFVLRAI